MFADSVMESSSTTGTGPYVLTGAVGASRTFSQDFADGEEVVYCASLLDKSKWEKVRGILAYGAPRTLTRAEVLKSSTGGAAIDWQPGDNYYVFSIADADALAGIMEGSFAAATRPYWVRFGSWFKADTPAAGFRQGYWYDKITGLQTNFAKFVEATGRLIFDDAVLPYPKGHIQGLTYQVNGVDPTNDLDIAAGTCMSDDGTERIDIVATTKQLDVAWAADNGATQTGALDTGAVGNNVYYWWAIKNPTTGVSGVLASLSATSPTMPSGYTKKRLFGWMTRSGGANLAFHTYELAGGGIEFSWSAKPLDVNAATITTTRRTDVLSVPTTFSVVAKVDILVSGATGSANNADIRCPDDADEAVFPGIYVQPGLSGTSSVCNIRTSASGAIAARANVDTFTGYHVRTLGFQWARRL